tara:strand:+ start:63 stop:425 length:363 start_codon:yes stop_codon:yes gene_type:complete
MTSNNYNLTLNTFKALEDFKICCKVSIIECMNSQHLDKLRKCMKLCLESIEAIDICQYFIASKSINVKQCITFVSTVVKKCIHECIKSSFDKHLKKVNKDTTAKAGKVFLDLLTKMKNKL